ncbi:MAG: MotA/TolQ/ExbB proton channel family protein [Verrucomicrobiales bacterium]|jgi:biopolymer transport protein ExbB|nr:MotA/TolQ/ExbB proton channel family protein [Verrucomicrobiales bacterium]
MNLSEISAEVMTLLDAGGWVFLALLALAFGIAFALLSLWNATRLPDAPLISSRDWLLLLRGKPGASDARARVREFLQRASDPGSVLEEMSQQLFSKTRRRIPFAFILISAAPLIGLLGTVSGMFSTFQGMAGTSLASPIDVISDGISEALITTQTGLIIGVPTFVVCSWIRSRHEELEIRFRQLASELLQPETMQS